MINGQGTDKQGAANKYADVLLTVRPRFHCKCQRMRFLSFNSTRKKKKKKLPLVYSEWREVSARRHEPMGCNHPYFLGCTLHIFNHVLLLTDDYSLQRLFRFQAPPPRTLAECLSERRVHVHVHVRECHHMPVKCKRTCVCVCVGGKRKVVHIMFTLSGDKLPPSCCLHGAVRGPRTCCCCC